MVVVFLVDVVVLITKVDLMISVTTSKWTMEVLKMVEMEVFKIIDHSTIKMLLKIKAIKL